MIIVKLKGGLGNQIFQYAMGLNLSIEKGSRFVLDLSKFDTDVRSFKLGYFDLDCTIITSFKVKILGSKPVKLIADLFNWNIYHVTIKDPVWSLINFSNFEFENLILDGYWSYNIYFQNTRKFLSNRLRLKSTFFNSEYNKLRKEIESVNSVAIHIRRGDYIEDQKNSDFFGIIPIDYYSNSANIIKERIENPLFFIFSDDPHWIENIFPKCENQIIVSSFILIEDIHEFDLMRRCKHHIIANSTFSWWAAYLNDHENGVVIMPKLWYKSGFAQNVYNSKEFLNIDGAIRV